MQCYLHDGKRLGALVELNCETDIVARSEEFRALAVEVALQVAATVLERSNNDPRTALMDTEYIREPGKTLRQLIDEVAEHLGERIVVRRIARFAVDDP